MEKKTADKIITEYLPKIYGFAVKKAYSYQEAEEISADIIKEVYSALLHNDSILNLEGYVWRISENAYSKYVSQKKKHVGISIDNLQIPYYEDFYSGDNSEELKRLRREIAFLTQKRRSVVYMFYYENKSVTAISREMDMAEGTVKWHLNKARNELKEGFNMERNIGKLGLSPITAKSFGHSGSPAVNCEPEAYLEDKLNLNIVYSVYHSPKSAEEIAEELGVTLVFIEDKIEYLERNGFLVKVTGQKYTTYVRFDSEYSLELNEKAEKKQLEIANILAEKYVPLVRKSIKDTEVYVPGGNYEVFEAAAVFYALLNKCCLESNKDLSKYYIKPTGGGDYIACVHLDEKPVDPDYVPTLPNVNYWVCGNMNRWSDKYPAMMSWSVDTRYCSRKGAWKNNLDSDYEYLYEYIWGFIKNDTANKEKFDRLKKRQYLTDDGKVNITVVKENSKEFFKKMPSLDSKTKNKFADFALELAVQKAKFYPPQMQDLIISWAVGGFIGSTVALMVMDILYGNGTFKPLTENERVTSNLIMFSDKLPDEDKKLI